MAITISKTDERCLKCEHNKDCDEKRMVMCAMAELPPPKQYLQPATADLTMPLAQDVLVKHDYRDIKIDKNTTVTIDLEEMKKKLTEDLWKSINCNFMNFGA